MCDTVVLLIPSLLFFRFIPESLTPVSLSFFSYSSCFKFLFSVSFSRLYRERGSGFWFFLRTRTTFPCFFVHDRHHHLFLVSISLLQCYRGYDMREMLAFVLNNP